MSVEKPKDKKVILETIVPKEKPIKESEEEMVDRVRSSC